LSYLGIYCWEKPPVHGEHLAGILDGTSGQVGHVADVQVRIEASKPAELV